MKRFVCLLLSAGLVSGTAVFFAGCQKPQSPDTRYEITAEYLPETSTITGMVKLEWRNAGGEEISALRFNLWANAYREGAAHRPVSPVHSASAYYDGTSYGSMEISSVSGAESWEVTGRN